jgi:2,7-dihydroxy-5-methyl-1-naphthoate 7-O-methyltransferase
MAEQREVDLKDLTDLATAWCVRVVSTLRVAEQMAKGVTHTEQLAQEAGCDAEMLTRVLRHLAWRGIFRQIGPAEFELNDAAHGLVEPSAGLDLDGFGGRMAGSWAGLLRTVRTGRTAYHEIFGRPFWEDLDAHPDIAKSFDALMGPQGHGTPDPEVLVRGDWETVGDVIVLGGVSPDDDPADHDDLLMMVLVGDKHRRLAEFTELARAAGLSVSVTGRQPSGRFVVETRPAAG